ncbi:MAG: glyoxalase/bleomycin resistance protein/dioxygenase [Firmicutes bacterium]|nr:glyoxalase/bleomycin resistance protein/dioxygenase [Bacillota bacterium]
MIYSIDHACFTVSNMERTIAFYRDILGMKVDWDSAAEGVVFKGPEADKVTGCPNTEQRLVFMSIGNNYRIEFVQFTPTGKPLVDNKASNIGAAHVCFKTDNLHELYHKLMANGVQLHCAPQHIGFGWTMYFRDPDGIILEAVQDDPT